MATRSRKQVETLTHDEASRKNIPTAEHQPVMSEGDRTAVQVAYERRNPDLDPQLVWRGKDMQDWSDLVVPAPPLFIQEKVHPKALIDDLLRQSQVGKGGGGGGGGGGATTSTQASSPTSTAYPRATPRPNSTSTTPTGPTG